MSALEYCMCVVVCEQLAGDVEVAQHHVGLPASKDVDDVSINAPQGAWPFLCCHTGTAWIWLQCEGQWYALGIMSDFQRPKT